MKKKSNVFENSFSLEYTKEEEQMIADLIAGSIELIRLNKRKMRTEFSNSQTIRMDEECSRLQDLLYKCALRKQLQIKK